MRCPFLRDEQVKTCEAAPFRKSLARATARGEGERCTSAAHASCPVAPHSHEAHPSATHCPFLRETLVQFCAATPAPTYVPWTSSPASRCAHDGHRFCELFRAAAGEAALAPSLVLAGGAEARVDVVDGVPVPGWLFYAANHTWLDAGDDGLWHLGVDAFLAQVVGRVERLAFLAVKGASRPAVVLTAHGIDMTLTLPRGEAIVAANTRLRSSLDHLTSDPYGLGWLFAVRAPAAPSYAGLRRGPAAREWMAGEVRRLSERVHASLAAPGAGRLAADGGRFAPDLLEHLEREEALRLLAELFPILDDGRHP